jgi:NTE family protein
MVKITEKTAFVFLGNSVGNAFDVGVAKVLFSKIKPDVVFATSMGSANASFILKDKNHLKNIGDLEKLWKIFDSRKLFKINPEIFYKFIFAESLFKNDGLRKNFSEILELDRLNLESLSLPLYIGAYNNTDKETVLFNKGNALDAVLASCAAPLYFPPYKIRDKEYLDGGINNRICIDKAIELGCRRIFVINLASKKRPGKSLFSKFRRSISLMKTAPISHLLNSKINKFIIEISPDFDKRPKRFTDSQNTELLITHGEEKANQILFNLGIN